MTLTHFALPALAVAVLACGAAHAAPGPEPAPRPSLAERFKSPASECRILKIIHGWPDEPQSQDNLIRDLLAQGFGGVVCNVSFDKYLQSGDHWQQFQRAVEQAKKAGMTLWLYDERGYPSGSAGGLTLRDHPEWEAHGLLVADALSEGGPVSLDAPPGKLFLAAAYPVREGQMDLTRALDLRPSTRDGKLTATLPPGRWQVMLITEDRLYEGAHASMSLGDKLPYINLLMPEPTARFLELTHQAYANHLGSDLGRFFAATFTDEPSLMSMFMRLMPYRPLPWAPGLAEEFRRRRGYALEPVVPALLADAGPGGSKARYDFWQTVGELVSANYFGQIRGWCRAHGICSGGHLLDEESVVDHVCLYGDFFRCLRCLDAPGMDCLTSIPAQVPWFDARLISSAAELEGRALTMCETSDFSQIYRPAGDQRPVQQVTETDIRGTCYRLMLNGIDTINSYYSFTGISGEQLRRLNAEVGRCSTLLRGGHRVADVAVVYPIESVWPRFVPARQGSTGAAGARVVEHAYRAVSDQLYAARRDFTYVDSRTLAEAQAAGGALTLGDLRWRAVVLPGVDTLPMAAWQNLARFWRSGGVIIAVGALPLNSEADFPCAEAKNLAWGIFGQAAGPHVQTGPSGGTGIYLPTGFEGLLSTALDAVLEPDAAVADPRAPLRVTHRRTEAGEVYFLLNDGPDPWQGEVRLSAQGPGRRWDPATGEMTPLADNRPALKLGPYDGVLCTYAATVPPRRLHPPTGELPGLALTPLPGVTPEVGKGEFVKSELTPQGPAWRSVGTLTKSKTDTFLFLAFRYPQPVNLGSATGLLLDCAVPAGQGTPANLLVILTDTTGAQFFADTGRPLSLAGRTEWFVSFDSLAPAGWSSNPASRLNLNAIGGLAVGWGGYYGTEGERVELTLWPTRAVAPAPR